MSCTNISQVSGLELSGKSGKIVGKASSTQQVSSYTKVAKAVAKAITHTHTHSELTAIKAYS